MICSSSKDGLPRLEGTIELTQALEMTRIQAFPVFMCPLFNHLMRNGMKPIVQIPIRLLVCTAHDALHATS
jgi:hypothetical protein